MKTNPVHALKLCASLVFVSLLIFPVDAQFDLSIASSFEYGGNNADVLYDMQPTADGGLLFAGTTNSTDNFDYDVAGNSGQAGFVIKVNAAGQQVWAKAFGGNNLDYIRAVVEASDGHIYAVGNSFSTNISGDRGGEDVFVVKMTSSGTEVWKKLFGSSTEDHGYGIHEDSNGRIIIIAQSYAFGTNPGVLGDLPSSASPNIGGPKLWFFKIDSDGNLTSTNTVAYGGQTGGDAYFPWRSIQVGSDIFVGGYTGGALSSGCTPEWGNNGLFVKLNDSGVEQWNKVYGGEGNQYIFGLTALNDGFLLTGSSSIGSNGCDVPVSLGNQDAYVIKTNNSGDLQWSRLYGGALDDMANSAIELANEGYLIGGISESQESVFNHIGGADSYLFTIDYNGNVINQVHKGGSREEGLLGAPQNSRSAFVTRNTNGEAFMATTSNSADGDVPVTIAVDNTQDVWLAKFEGSGGSGNNSCNWIGFVHNRSGYREPNEADCDFIGNGRAYIAPSLTNQSLYWTGFTNVNDFGVSADAVRVEARVKNPAAEGGISCFDVELWAYGTTDHARVVFMDPASSGNTFCEQYCQIGTGLSSLNGQTSDLSSLLHSFSGWHTIALEVSGNQVRAYYDGVLQQTVGYAQPLGGLSGLKVAFKGSGSVDWVRVTNTTTNEQVYGEEFSNCAQNCPTCQETLTLNQSLISGGAYSASQSISANGSVAAGSNVELTAAQSITLQPGFHAQTGSAFTARIADCTPATLSQDDAAGDVVQENHRFSDPPEKRPAQINLTIAPNPFRNETLIRYTLPEDRPTQLVLIDMLGRAKVLQSSAMQPAGIHEYRLRGADLSSGIYFIQLQTGEEAISRKIQVVH